ncbi:MAG: hypothetical protein NTW25_00935 [Candidatus Kapabacteria bacterium]|nr:hypothetical protein [Candidatus Kapabacteria bacterium]
MKKLILSFALLLTFAIPSYSEWKFTRIWKKNSWDYGKYDIGDTKLSPNDSVLFVIGVDFIANTYQGFYKINTINGDLIKLYDNNQDSITNFNFSKDGSYMSASGYGYLGLIDTSTFRYTNKINFKNIKNHHFNEERKIITGFSSNSIKMFNSETKKLIKEYDTNYFAVKEIDITNIALSKVDDKLIYSYNYPEYHGSKDPPDIYSNLKIIDKNGKIIYQIESNIFALSNDGIKLVYFCEKNTKVKVLDLKTMEVISEGEGYVQGNESALSIKFSNDDKYVFNGYNHALKRLELLNNKTIICNSFGSVSNITFSINTNNIIYYDIHGSQISGYNVDTQSSLSNDIINNTFKLLPNPVLNLININFNLIDIYNIEIKVLNSTGLIVTKIENQSYEQGSYSNKYNISDLPNGAYYLQIKMNNEIYPQILNFVKGN